VQSFTAKDIDLGYHRSGFVLLQDVLCHSYVFDWFWHDLLAVLVDIRDGGLELLRYRLGCRGKN
jgi:hypothetical protein